MGIALTVLGCDGSYPGPGGACSGYLLRGGGATAWLDAGSGTLANLQRHVELPELDAVILSHEHPDHWSDIEGLRVAWGYLPSTPGPGGRELPVYAPAGLSRNLYKEGEDGLSWRVVTDSDEVSVSGMRIVFSRTDHGPETLAARIECDGTALGYSADSGPGWSLDSLGSDLDLALCEATYTTIHEGSAQHMSARQAGESARGAGVRRLVLTHRWPTVSADSIRDEGSTAFGRDVELAEIGAEYSL